MEGTEPTTFKSNFAVWSSIPALLPGQDTTPSKIAKKRDSKSAAELVSDMRQSFSDLFRMRSATRVAMEDRPKGTTEVGPEPEPSLLIPEPRARQVSRTVTVPAPEALEHVELAETLLKYEP